MAIRAALLTAACFLSGCGTVLWDGISQKTAAKATESGSRTPTGTLLKIDGEARNDEESKPADAATESPKEDAEKAKKDEGKEESEEKPKGHVTVRCVPARKRAFPVTVDGLGRTEALPENLGSLTAAVEGHVHKLLARLGQAVQAGQPIVELDTTIIKTTLAERTATRDSLIATLRLLQSLPRPEERRATELAVDQAKIGIERARDLVERLRPLVESKSQAASPAQLFDAEQALKQAELSHKTALAQLKLLTLGPRPEAVAEAQARIAIAEEAVANSLATLSLHTIRAPIAGIVDSLNCHPGQTLTVGTPIGEIVDTRRLFATVYFPSRSARSVRMGMPARIAFADGERRVPGAKADELTGEVVFVGRIADPQTGNYPVRILVDNSTGRLRVGQVVRSIVALRTEEPTMAVPDAALFDQGEGPVLAVVRDGTIKLLHPELGTAEGGYVAVHKTDLHEGDQVVVEGAYNVPDGTIATIETAAAGQAEEKDAPELKKDAKAQDDKPLPATPAKAGDGR